MSTVRITNIHPGATKKDLVNLLVSHQLQSDVVFVESADGTKTAIATFESRADTHKLFKLPDHSLVLRDEVLTMDEEFLRFTTLHEGRNARVEYVPSLVVEMKQTEHDSQHCRSAWFKWPCIQYVEVPPRFNVAPRLLAETRPRFSNTGIRV